MNFNDYQIAARLTSGFDLASSRRENILMAALGLSGEVGELNDRIKKMFYHDHPEDIVKLEEEVGDILWYVAEMCTALRFNLGIVAEHNIEKLRRRYPEGFTSEASINRTEYSP